MRLTTHRCEIREFELSDSEGLFAAMSDPEIGAMHSGGFCDISAARDYIELLRKEYEIGIFKTLAVVERQSGFLIGSVTIDKHNLFHRAEISYWIINSHRNQGYATEVVAEIIKYGLSKMALGRIQAIHFANNPASGRVLEKAGMVYEGTLRCYIGMNGQFSDARMYSFIKADLRDEYE